MPCFLMNNPIDTTIPIRTPKIPTQLPYAAKLHYNTTDSLTAWWKRHQLMDEPYRHTYVLK